MSKVILSDMLYVPAYLVSNEMKEAFTYKTRERLFTRKQILNRCCGECRWFNKCENPKSSNPKNVCEKFEAPVILEWKTTLLKTYKQLDDGTYAFNRGDFKKIKELFGHLEFDDQRKYPSLGIPDLKFTSKLYEDQQRTVNDWLKHGYGIIKCPTAWGKSVSLTWLILHLNLKAIILAQEKRHLIVMWDAFREHTNITKLEEELGEPLIGRLAHENKGTATSPIFRKTKKFKEKIYPITLSTFQSLSTKGGKDLLEKVKNEYGFLALEECHHESAWTFHKVTQSFNSWYRGGQTATPTRKDGKHPAIYDTIGPITAIGRTEQMLPKVTFIHTGINVPDWVFLGQYPHSRLDKWLANSFEYQKVVCEQVLQDVQDGRKVFVYTKRRNNATWLERQVTLSGYNAKVIMSGSENTDQNKISELLLDNRLSCIVGTNVMKENVNIPPLDVVHLPFPNFGKENEEQIVGRIRRYIRDSKTKEILYDAKPQPLIRVYTVTSNNDIPSKALHFRKNLYKKWKFDFDEEIYLEDERLQPKGKTIGEL